MVDTEGRTQHLVTGGLIYEVKCLGTIHADMVAGANGHMCAERLCAEEDGNFVWFKEDDRKITRRRPLSFEVTAAKKDALAAINSAFKKDISSGGGPKAEDDYCDRRFCLASALQAHKKTIKEALGGN